MDVADWVMVLEVSSVATGSVAVVSSKASLVEVDSAERVVLEVSSVATNSVAVVSRKPSECQCVPLCMLGCPAQNHRQ